MSSEPTWKHAHLLQTDEYKDKIDFFREKWGMKCNPFWYDSFVNRRGENILDRENLQGRQIANVFIEIIYMEKRYTAVEFGDFVKMAVEHGSKEDEVKKLISVSIRKDFIQTIQHEGETFITLSKTAMEVCY